MYIPWFIYLYSSINRHFEIFSPLTLVNSITMKIRVHMYLFEYLFSVILGIYLEEECLSHMATLCLTFWGTSEVGFVQYPLIFQNNRWDWKVSCQNISPNIWYIRKKIHSHHVYVKHKVRIIFIIFVWFSLQLVLLHQ